MTTVAIVQSSYIPWKGYFDLIHDADVFVFLDDVQMTKRDWRSRNLIKTPRGTEWLTIPVKGGRHQLICETEIAQGNWQERHRKSIQTNYQRAPYLREYAFLLDCLYDTEHEKLSEFNRQTTSMVCKLLGLDTELLVSTDFAVRAVKTDRLIEICQQIGTTTYLSGPKARAYIDEGKFHAAGIDLVYKEYSGYPEYPQLFPPFEHGVTILDLLFNCGPAAPEYIWGWREMPLRLPPWEKWRRVA